MTSKRLEKALVEQIGHELRASHYYLAIAVYFGSQSLDKWADFFYRQSLEEREHALKIVHFLVDVGVEATIPAIPAQTSKFKSALAAVKGALDNERDVTRQFQTMAEHALADKDFVGFQFLQWFLEEQVEEEASMQKLVDLIKVEDNLFRAQDMLGGASCGCSGCGS